MAQENTKFYRLSEILPEPDLENLLRFYANPSRRRDAHLEGTWDGIKELLIRSLKAYGYDIPYWLDDEQS
jgi:hypothetical protein